MNQLLDEVLVAHGGAERWRSVSVIAARGRLGGLLPQRFPGGKLADFTVRVDPTVQRTGPVLRSASGIRWTHLPDSAAGDAPRPWSASHSPPRSSSA